MACDRHVGEAFPVRCGDCDLLALSTASKTVERRLVRYIPNSKCELHSDYPLPCDLCFRLEGANHA